MLLVCGGSSFCLFNDRAITADNFSSLSRDAHSMLTELAAATRLKCRSDQNIFDGVKTLRITQGVKVEAEMEMIRTILAG